MSSANGSHLVFHGLYNTSNSSLGSFSISDQSSYFRLRAKPQLREIRCKMLVSLWNLVRYNLALDLIIKISGCVLVSNSLRSNNLIQVVERAEFWHLFQNKMIVWHAWPIRLPRCRQNECCPYPEPVYTGWSSVHWNATGMPLVDPVYTGTPLEKLSWNSPTLECHWINLVESAPHWDATGETLTFTAYTGTPLEGLWQPAHAPTHIV